VDLFTVFAVNKSPRTKYKLTLSISIPEVGTKLPGSPFSPGGPG